MTDKQATIEDIKRLIPKIKTHWDLCEFLGKTEKEVLVTQTIHACKINYDEGKGCFSFLGDLRERPHNEYISSYQSLIDNGMFTEGLYKGKKVIFPTKKLILKLEAFLA